MSEGAPDHVIDSLDQSIVARLNEIGKEYVPTSDEITWKDVRNALGEDDLAVEFSKTDNGYMAILLRKGWKKPKVVRLHLYNADVSLFARSDSTGYSAESKRREWVQSKAIWTRAIKRSFPRTQYGKIYFSPDAEFFTSDSPIIFEREGSNKEVGFMELNLSNLNITYPITRNLLVRLWDRDSYKQIEPFDRTIRIVDEEFVMCENIRQYIWANNEIVTPNDSSVFFERIKNIQDKELYCKH